MKGKASFRTRVKNRVRKGKKKYTTAVKVYNKSRVNAGLGFPKQMKMTHRYFDNQAIITSVPGTIGFIPFRANGMFDPYALLGGHQPYYFDQMSALYNHWVVIGSRIKVKFVPGSDWGRPMMIGLTLQDDTTAFTSFEQIAEYSQNKHGLMSELITEPYIITLNYSAKKVFGGSILANDNLRGSASADPTEQSIFGVYAQPTDLAANQTVNIQVDIEYIAVWTELKEVLPS